MSGRLFNPEGLPWTIGIGLPLTLLLILFTGGTFAVLLGLYLAYWIYLRHQRSGALFWYGLLVGLCSIRILPHHVLPTALWDTIGILTCLAWVAAEFTLRQEILTAYLEHEGYELQISLLWTFIFGSLYLNYCIPPYTPRQANAA